jgi:hypothetical protein
LTEISEDTRQHEPEPNYGGKGGYGVYYHIDLSRYGPSYWTGIDWGQRRGQLFTERADQKEQPDATSE